MERLDFLRIAAIALCALALSACGGNSAATPGNQAAATTGTPAASAPASSAPPSGTSSQQSVVVVNSNLEFSASSYTVGQVAGSVTVTVTRTGGSSGAVSVGYATSDGSAIAVTDYTAVSGTLQWADGDAGVKTFVVQISTGTPFTGSKSFSVTLSGPSSGAALGSPGSATVTITGAGSASTGPAAPTNLLMTLQGLNAPDPSRNYLIVPQNPNTTSIGWTQATAGAAPISYNKVYRSTTSASTGFSLL